MHAYVIHDENGMHKGITMIKSIGVNVYRLKTLESKSQKNETIESG